MTTQVAILIEHSPNWRVIVGPFTNQDFALDWISNHSLSLEDAKTKILEYKEP